MQKTILLTTDANTVPNFTSTSISVNADGPHNTASHKSNIPCCMPSVIKWQQTSVHTENTLLHRQLQLSVIISTYMHSEAQTPLKQFVVDALYKQVSDKYTTNQADGV